MIQIPDPCNEDFSKMTPTERGAFCNKCSVDTYDFRPLSNLQINTIIKENAGNHVCGRFNKSQLEDLNAGFLNWKNQNTRTFQSKFVFALIFVFGLGLFSCEQEDEATIQEVSQIELIDQKGILQYINADYEVSEIDLLNYISDFENEIEKPIECRNTEQLAGIVAYEEEVYPIEVRGEVMVAGGIGMYPEYIEYVEAVIPDDSVENILPKPIVPSTIFQAKAYPNPTKGQSTVALDIVSEGQFEVMLYDLNGRLISTIHSGFLNEGRKNFELDLTPMNSGIYFVKILSQGQNETIKISRVN
jgi:hypothetical protein